MDTFTRRTLIGLLVLLGAACGSDPDGAADGQGSPDTESPADAGAAVDAAADTAPSTGDTSNHTPDATSSPDTMADAGGADDTQHGGCTTSADCPQPATGCQGNVCLAGVCTPQPLADMTPCDDGGKCTDKAFCKGGSCTLATTKACADGNPCTNDGCDNNTGACTHKSSNKGGPCDDGLSCTQGTVCDGEGVCSGGSNACGCSSIKDCAAFEDDDPCNGTLYCNTTKAKPTCEVLPASVVICDASQDGPCEQTACDTSSGKCATTPKDDGAACDDGSPCSKGDACLSGQCSGAVNTCQCQVSADCAGYEDNNACNGTLFCDTSSLPYTCKVNPASLVTCPKSPGQCQVSSCDPKSGGCGLSDVADGTPCDDGDAKTAGDVCKAGACKSGTSTAQCTSDSDCAKFEDGDFCNGVLFCNQAEGLCQVNPATSVSCPSAKDTDCSKNTCEPSSGLCKMAAVAEGTACSDGSSCTVGEVCKVGMCTPSANVCQCGKDSDCASQEDGDACNGTLFCNKQSGKCEVNPTTVVTCPTVGDTGCSKNTCQPKTGSCAPEPAKDNAPCDDDNPCTAGDACDKGACVGTTVCQCSSDSDCASQDDGDLCNGTLFCDKATGSCKTNPATVKVCPTAGDTACSKNACEPITGTCAMKPAFNGAQCDADGNPCTQNDYCDGGACKPGKNTCGCYTDADCTGKQGGDKCILDLFCDKASFTCKPTKTVQCDTSGDTACSKTACNPTTGTCETQMQPVGTVCGESAICAGAQVCDAKGGCVPGEASDCDDADACTKDSCDPKSGCTYAALDSGACDDGSVCTDTDSCKKGQCVGTAKDCSDDSPCTDDACDPNKGCVHLPNQATSCDDGDTCTQGDFCLQGLCLPGTKQLLCDDGNPCTTDSCDPKQGCVTKAASGAQCDDGSLCTTGDVCKTGACQGTALTCDDGNACTKDACDPKTGCKNAGVVGQACDDGNACTVGDKCISSGACTGGAPKQCDDGKPCTLDWCDALQGCQVKAKVGGACDDGSACTVNDACAKGACVGSPRDCDDAKVCTKDSCDKTKGCVNVATTGKTCDDNNACTTGDTCTKSGACVATKGAKCNDDNLCTSDGCDPTAGCTHIALDGLTCSDGDKCTSGDVCQAGSCKGSPAACDDGEVCTKDSCDKAKGCVYTAVTGAPCNDGDACTTGDACSKAGSCAPTGTKTCDDGNSCTKDSCDAKQGCLVLKLDVSACNDGDKCTKDDACVDGTCKGGAVTCDDGNACTTDTCDGKVGCKTTPNTAQCSDDDACTTKDACKAGKCVGQKVTCDDKIPCTSDSCAPATGCAYVPVAANCDDKNPCTTDVCSAAAGCLYSPNTLPCDDGDDCGTTLDTCSGGQCIGGGGPKLFAKVYGDTFTTAVGIDLAVFAGQLIVAGRMESAVGSTQAAGFSKTGQPLWQRSLMKGGTAYRVMPQGKALVFGGTAKVGKVTGTMWLRGLDAQTKPSWSWSWTEPNGGAVTNPIFAATATHAFASFISRTGGHPNPYTARIARVDAAGKQVWAKGFGSSLAHNFHGLVPIGDDVIAVGEDDKLGTYGNATPRRVIRVDAKGAVLWQRYPGPFYGVDLGSWRVDAGVITFLGDKGTLSIGSDGIPTGRSTWSLGHWRAMAPAGDASMVVAGDTLMRLDAYLQQTWTQTLPLAHKMSAVALAAVDEGIVVLTDGAPSKTAQRTIGLIRTDAWGATNCVDSGGCALKGTASCDDKKACTADACDGVKGCVHTVIKGCKAPPAPLPDGACASQGRPKLFAGHVPTYHNPHLYLDGKVLAQGGVGHPTAVAPASDGFVVLGNAAGDTHLGAGPAIMRVDALGRRLWTTVVPANSSSRFYAAVQTQTGWLAGGHDYGKKDFLVARFDAKGKLLSTSTLGDGEQWEVRGAAHKDSVTLLSRGTPGGGSLRPYVVRVGADGKTVYAKGLGNSGSTRDLTAFGEHDVALLYYVGGICSGSGKACLARLDASGQLVWAVRPSIPQLGLRVVRLADDLVLSDTSGGKLIVTRMKGSDGKQVWQRTWTTLGHTMPLGGGAKGFYGLLKTTTDANNEWNARLLRFDGVGDLIGDHAIAQGGRQTPTLVLEQGDGLTMLSQHANNGTGESGIAVARLDRHGNASCAASGGCITKSACSDSNPCTLDGCSKGVCTSSAAPDGSLCSAANGVGTCSGGQCKAK